MLDNSEAQIVFEKTPRIDREGNPSSANLNLIDKIIVVDSSQFNTSKSTIIGYAVQVVNMQGI